MTKTQTETEIQEKCENCDAEIRGGSQFCFSCGESLNDIDEVVEETNVVEFPKQKIAEEIAEVPEEFLVPEEAPVEEPIPKPVEESVDGVESFIEPIELPKDRSRRRNERMETAASIKKRERLRVKKPTEVVWDRPESSLQFVIGAIVILVVAAVIFYFAIVAN